MTAKISFTLNGKPETVAGLSPTMTLLNYLRRTKRLTGTKEGCAEGDCGACTVTVGERQADGDMRYRAVNACIQFLPMLDGKAIITVEGVAGPDGTLHPCQQAIVDRHGSQCGFCTPGFVMSLYARSADTSEAGPELSADDTLAGNLCRCTGYGPLVAAANDTAAAGQPAWDRDRRAGDAAALAALPTAGVSGLSDTSGACAILPRTADDLAAAVLARPDATIVAGATDVGLWVTKQRRRLETTIHLGQIADLKTVAASGGVLRIGAAATYTDCQFEIARHFPDFGELIRRLGSVQIRNSATLCGNVANGSPIGDTPPALIALGAEVVLRKGDVRRRLPVEDYFIDYGKQDRAPGEFIEAIEIPLPGADRADRLACYKVSKRFDQDISTVCAAFNIAIEDGRIARAQIAFGGMAAIPKRASALQAVLIGRSWTQDTIDAGKAALLQDFKPISDMRGSAAYRMTTAQNLLQRLFLETAAPHHATRLVGPGAVAL